jgi:hypothetical protein
MFFCQYTSQLGWKLFFSTLEFVTTRVIITKNQIQTSRNCHNATSTTPTTPTTPTIVSLSWYVYTQTVGIQHGRVTESN